jgi:hypothetical protein
MMFLVMIDEHRSYFGRARYRCRLRRPRYRNSTCMWLDWLRGIGYPYFPPTGTGGNIYGIKSFRSAFQGR